MTNAVVFYQLIQSISTLLRQTFVAICGLMLVGCASTPPPTKALPGGYEFMLRSQNQDKLQAAKSESEVTPADSHKTLELARLARQQGNVDRALYQYVKAVELDQTNTEALLAIGQIHDQQGHHTLSEIAYRMVLAQTADDVFAMEALGINLVRQGQYNEATGFLNRVLTQDSRRIRAYNALGVIADLNSQFEAAKTHYLTALALDRRSVLVLGNISYSCYLSGDWDLAEHYYNQLLQIDVSNSNNWLNYGLLQARRGKPLEALRAFEKVLPKAQAYNELGYVYLIDNKLDNAEQMFRTAITEAPAFFTKAYENLNTVHNLKQSREPVPDFMRLSLQPQRNM